MSTDSPLGTPTPTATDDLGQPEEPLQIRTADQAMRPLTFDDILQTARLPERRAKICLRADLEADRDALISELAKLVDAEGNLLEQEPDPERSVGESAEARAVELSEQLQALTDEMAGSMRYVRMRGLDSTALAEFNAKHEPKGDEPRDDYNTRLVAECAIEPTLTVEQVQQMQTRLGNLAILNLVETALTVCYGGGVSVPKSPKISLPRRGK